MRNLTATVVCFLMLGIASAQAEESQVVKSAQQRWAADGSGGTPDYIRHVVPMFSKLGCNMRACHGSLQGQNGFRLSLFGFEPEQDHKELIAIDEESEGDGPRVNIKEPNQSLFLIKPSSEDEHEGGQRMKKDSWQYRVLQQWIAAGAPYDPKGTIKLQRLEIIPAEILFTNRWFFAWRTNLRHRSYSVQPCDAKSNWLLLQTLRESGLPGW